MSQLDLAAGRPGRPRALLVVAGLAYALSAASQTVATVPNADELANPRWVQEGREKFAQACAYCHGQEGDAGKHRPFRERIDWDAGQIHDVISNGRRRGANVMPAWRDSIPDDDIWRIVAYIKSVGGKPRPQE